MFIKIAATDNNLPFTTEIDATIQIITATLLPHGRHVVFL